MTVQPTEGRAAVRPHKPYCDATKIRGVTSGVRETVSIALSDFLLRSTPQPCAGSGIWNSGVKFCLGSSRGSDEERAQLGRAEKGQVRAGSGTDPRV